MSNSSIRRRDFVAGATAVATGIALTSDALAGGKSSLYGVTPAEFAQLIGHKFAVDGLSEEGTRQTGTMVLKEVVSHDTVKDPNRPSHLRKEGFSLTFESRDSALSAGTHRVSGGGIPVNAIDLQELLDQRKPGQRYYEAVFN